MSTGSAGGIMTAPAPGVGTFQAILWKELREGAKWGALGLLLVAAALTFAIRGDLGWISMGLEVTFGSNDALMPTALFTFATLLTGLMIGLAQVIPENRGDRWSFLAHRPVDRATLFWGKVVAGVLLYTLAALVPLAFAMAWLGMAGHAGLPFDWREARPEMADWMCGFVYYCVGLLMGMRDARWYGSRALGVGTAIVCSLFVVMVPAFWEALLVSALGVLLVGTAARGTWIAGGTYETQPRVSRAAVGVTVGIGLAIVGAIVFGILLFLAPSDSEQPPRYDYVVMADGTIGKTVTRNGVLLAVNDLAGRPIARYKDPQHSRAELISQMAASVGVPLNPDGQYLDDGGYRGTNDLFVRVSLPGFPIRPSWFFIRRERLIAGYDRTSGRLTGWVGPDGFTAGTMPPAHRFDGQLEPSAEDGPSLLTFPDGVYRVDGERRHIEKIFTPPEGESVLGGWGPDPEMERVVTVEGRPQMYMRSPFDIVATTKHIYVLTAPPDTSAHRDSLWLILPLDPRAAGYGTVTVATRPAVPPGAPVFAWYRAQHGTLPGWENRPELLTRFGPQATVDSQLTLPPLHVPPSPASWASVIVESITLPIVIDVGSEVRDRLSSAPSDDSWSAEQSAVSWFVVVVASLAWAALAFRRGQAHAFAKGRLALWAALTFALGPLGVLAMLCLIEWPGRETCPSCHRQRVVTRERCEHCGARFASPVADGTEIFEPVTV